MFKEKVLFEKLVKFFVQYNSGNNIDNVNRLIH